MHIPKDKIKMNRKEIVWELVAWVDLVQDRERRRDVVKTVMNLRVP
jgi:hypothetical protein